MTAWGLLLAFDTDSPEFVRGFEAARFYERCRNDHTNWSTYVHPSNAEMVLRVAEATGRQIRGEETDAGDWLEVFVT